MSSGDATSYAQLFEKGIGKLSVRPAREFGCFWPNARTLRHPAVVEYMKIGLAGGCNTKGYKIRRRGADWHITPLPPRVDGFMSGMSDRMPFLVVREMRALTATNTLYTVTFKGDTSHEQRCAIGLCMLHSRVRSKLLQCGRVYPGGLLKFEPGDLNSLEVPLVPSVRGAGHFFEAATRLLIDGHEEEAVEMATEWVEQRAAAQGRTQLPVRALAY